MVVAVNATIPPPYLSKISKELAENAKDGDCSRKPALFPQDGGPVVTLFSFPGSGNTWIRQLITAMTGVRTGSVIPDKSLVEPAMAEGVRNERVAAVKWHYNIYIKGRDPRKGDGAILVFR